MSNDLGLLKAAIERDQLVVKRCLDEVSGARKLLSSRSKRPIMALPASVDHFDQLVKSATRLAEAARSVHKSLGEYLSTVSAASRSEFEVEFPQRCQGLGLAPVTGSIDKGYRVRGAIEIRTNFSRGQVRVSTSSETRTVSPPTATDTIEVLKPIYKRLYDRPFDPLLYERALIESFYRAGGRNGESLLLAQVHRQMFLARQDDSFFKDTSPKKLVGYPLDEFSVDLGRLLSSDFREQRSNKRTILELGRDGIIVFTDRGSFESYKFLRVTG